MDGLSALLDPLGQPEFTSGLGAGGLAAAVVAIVGLLWRRLWHRPAPVGGLALAAATLPTVVAPSVPGDVAVAVAVCAAAGIVTDVLGRRRLALPLTIIAAFPGAALLATTDAVSGSTFRWALAATVGIGGPLVATVDRRWRSLAITPALLAVTAGGIYATVPDTEQALVLLGVAVAVAATGWPLRLASAGGAGSMATVAVVVWVVAVGGVGRDGSVVGGLACLGLLVLAPSLHVLGAGTPLPRSITGAVAVLLPAHVVIVLWMSRVAGLRSGAPTAAAIAAIGVAVVATAWTVIARARGPISPAADLAQTSTALR